MKLKFLGRVIDEVASQRVNAAMVLPLRVAIYDKDADEAVNAPLGEFTVYLDGSKRLNPHRSTCCLAWLAKPLKEAAEPKKGKRKTAAAPNPTHDVVFLRQRINTARMIFNEDGEATPTKLLFDVPYLVPNENYEGGRLDEVMSRMMELREKTKRTKVDKVSKKSFMLL